MNYDWNWRFFFDQAAYSDQTYLDWIINGLGWTIAVALGAWIIAFVLGSVIGVMRTMPNRFLVFIGNAWVELFRNIPLLLQLFLWIYVIPEFLPKDLAIWVKQDLPAFATGIVGLALFTSARVAEQVRAGIQSLPRGQSSAGLAIGLNPLQTYRYIVLPMAFRIMIPPLTSEFMNAFKNSSVTYAIGVVELVSRTTQIQEEASHSYEVYIVVTGLYFACAMLVNRLMAWLEKRTRVPGYIAAK